MNKLRTLSLGGGGTVVALAVWASVRYGGPSRRFIEAAALGLLAAGIPSGIARLKARLRSVRYRLANTDDGFSEERGSIFVSQSRVNDPVDHLESIRTTIKNNGAFEEIERGKFGGVPGLKVIHSGFHSSMVRVADSGHIVVTGVSERTESLAETAGRACSLTFERTRNNPFVRTKPVRGGPRVFLGVLVFVVLLAGMNAIGAGAYSTSTYNAAERAVLVGMDAQADIDPRISLTDAKLRKAAFLVTVVDEASMEIQWAENDTKQIADYGRQATVVSEDAQVLLADARADGVAPERANRIETNLHQAEQSVARALEDRADQEELEDTEKLRRLADRLRSTEAKTERTFSLYE